MSFFLLSILVLGVVGLVVLIRNWSSIRDAFRQGFAEARAKIAGETIAANEATLAPVRADLATLPEAARWRRGRRCGSAWSSCASPGCSAAGGGAS